MMLSKKELTDKLNNELIPFWNNLADFQHGGFYGTVNNSGEIFKKANKGSMLQVRILWFYARLFQYKSDEVVKKYALHAYEFVTKYLFGDKGGIIWEVDYQGNLLDDTYNLYYQAFALYALSEYYISFKDPKTLIIINNLFSFIETNFKNARGYIEQLDLNSNRVADLGIPAERTMNSLLHLLESYTTYYEATNNKAAQKALIKILKIFNKYVYNHKLKRLEVLFNHRMQSISNYYSYGHDIEASWLLDKAASLINDLRLKNKIMKITTNLVKQIYRLAIVEDGVKMEVVDNNENKNYVWWIQAEAVLGFYKKGIVNNNQDYLNQANLTYKFIRNYFINQNNEWYWQIGPNKKPDLTFPLVSNWKCPYHNGRMYLELIKDMS